MTSELRAAPPSLLVLRMPNVYDGGSSCEANWWDTDCTIRYTRKQNLLPMYKRWDSALYQTVGESVALRFADNREYPQELKKIKTYTLYILEVMTPVKY